MEESFITGFFLMKIVRVLQEKNMMSLVKDVIKKGVQIMKR